MVTKGFSSNSFLRVKLSEKIIFNESFNACLNFPNPLSEATGIIYKCSSSR